MDEPVYLLSMDPGTTMLGVAVSEIDPATGDQRVVDAHSVSIQRIAETRYADIADLYGMRAAKLRAVEHVTDRLLLAWRPVAVVSEAPYLGRFPQAFAALVECVGTIRRACIGFDAGIGFSTIDPPTVKNAFGVRGKDGNKDAMRQAIMRVHKGLDVSGIDIAGIDEHAIDAVGVGRAYMLARLSR